MDKPELENPVAGFIRSFYGLCAWWRAVMSVLDDFARMRLYRNRAAEFEELADKALLPTAQHRYRVIARHYKELADREERADKVRMAEHLELLRLKRREAAE